MEEKISRKPYVTSDKFLNSRNIILDAHLIIYRITIKQIEVLDIIHSASSIHKIRSSRSIRL
jgi:hypothetical protein